MPDVVEISDFNYDLHVEDATEDAEARKASTEDVEATPAIKDSNPIVDP
jgi:hypothetical protein